MKKLIIFLQFLFLSSGALASQTSYGQMLNESFYNIYGMKSSYSDIFFKNLKEYLAHASDDESQILFDKITPKSVDDDIRPILKKNLNRITSIYLASLKGQSLADFLTFLAEKKNLLNYLDHNNPVHRKVILYPSDSPTISVIRKRYFREILLKTTSMKDSNKGSYRSFGVEKILEISQHGEQILKGPSETRYTNLDIGPHSVSGNKVIDLFSNLMSEKTKDIKKNKFITLDLVDIVLGNSPRYGDAILDMAYSQANNDKKFIGEINRIIKNNPRCFKHVNPVKFNFQKYLSLDLKHQMSMAFFSENQSLYAHDYKHLNLELFQENLKQLGESLETKKYLLEVESVLINEIVLNQQKKISDPKLHKRYITALLLTLLDEAERNSDVKDFFKNFILLGDKKVDAYIPNFKNKIRSQNYIIDTFLMNIGSTFKKVDPLNVLNKIIDIYSIGGQVDDLVSFSYQRFYYNNHHYFGLDVFDKHINTIRKMGKGHITLFEKLTEIFNGLNEAPTHDSIRKMRIFSKIVKELHARELESSSGKCATLLSSVIPKK